MSEPETFSLSEVAQAVDVALDPALLATKITLAEIRRKRPKLAFHVAECLCALCGARDTKMAAASPSEFHYAMGQLCAIDLKIHDGDEDDEHYIDNCLASLAGRTEGQRSSNWQRIRRVLNQGRESGDSHGKKGSVATIDGRKGKGTKRRTDDLRTLIDFMAINAPVGIDLLSESPTQDRFQTLPIESPITIAFGEGKDEETMRIATDKRGHSCVTWAMHEEGWREVAQDSMENDDVAFVGEAYELHRWFGRSLRNYLPMPVTMNLGEQPLASWLTIIRMRNRIGLLLRRPKGVVTVEQGDNFWRFDPAAVCGDTFGTVTHISKKDQITTCNLDDDNEGEDTLLEPPSC